MGSSTWSGRCVDGDGGVDGVGDVGLATGEYVASPRLVLVDRRTLAIDRHGAGAIDSGMVYDLMVGCAPQRPARARRRRSLRAGDVVLLDSA